MSKVLKSLITGKWLVVNPDKPEDYYFTSDVNYASINPAVPEPILESLASVYVTRDDQGALKQVAEV